MGESQKKSVWFRGKPIIRTAGIYLQPWGIGNEARFIRVFRETWKIIPYCDRRRIVGYFREKHAQVDWGDAEPMFRGRYCWVELVDNCSNFTRKGDGSRVMAYFQSWGCADCRMGFWSPVVERMPDEHLRALIGHELAHALCIAMGFASHAPENHSDDDFWREADVSEVLFQWGLEDDAMLEWERENARDLIHPADELEADPTA